MQLSPPAAQLAQTIVSDVTQGTRARWSNWPPSTEMLATCLPRYCANISFKSLILFRAFMFLIFECVSKTLI
jgi:hypothetical protein